MAALAAVAPFISDPFDTLKDPSNTKTQTCESQLQSPKALNFPPWHNYSEALCNRGLVHVASKPAVPSEQPLASTAPDQPGKLSALHVDRWSQTCPI